MKNKITNTNTMFLSNIYVYVMFARSYDYSTKNGGVHLISSVYSHPSLFNFEKLGVYLSSKEEDYLKEVLLSSSGQFIIVRVINDLPDISNGKGENFSVIKTVNHSDNLIEFILPVSILFTKLLGISSENYTGILEGVIGSFVNREEQFDSHLNNTLFVYENISWSNIVELHKLCDIFISGATKSNRWFLGSVQHNLSLILHLYKVTKKDIYLSFKNLRYLDRCSSLFLSNKSSDFSGNEKAEFDIDSDTNPQSSSNLIDVNDNSSVCESNLIKLNKEMQRALRVLILTKAIERSIAVQYSNKSEIDKLIKDYNNSLSYYNSKLIELNRKISLKSNHSHGLKTQKSRIEKIIYEKSSKFKGFEEKLKWFEEKIPIFEEFLNSVEYKSDSEIAELYTNFIVTRNKKVLDPNLSLIKSNTKKGTRRGHIYEFNTSSYFRSLRKNKLSQYSNGITNGTRSIYTNSGKYVKNV